MLVCVDDCVDDEVVESVVEAVEDIVVKPVLDTFPPEGTSGVNGQMLSETFTQRARTLGRVATPACLRHRALHSGLTRGRSLTNGSGWQVWHAASSVDWAKEVPHLQMS